MALTQETLTEYMADHFDLQGEELTSQTLLFSSGLLDSFSLLDVITFVEQEAGIRVNALDVNLDNLDSVDRILDFVARTKAS